MADVLSLAADGWRLAGAPWRPQGDLFAVLGKPVAHSLSPRMQNAALRARGVDAEYRAVEIDPGQLRDLKGRCGDLGLAGFNVTAPHKAAVAALCDGRTDQARVLGAVNTVKVEDGRWLGHNTDSGGVLAVLSQAWPDEEPPARAVVLGAGGSARASVDALLRWGVERIEVRNRSESGRREMEVWRDGLEGGSAVTVAPLVGGGEDAASEACVWLCCLAGGVDAAPYLPVAAGRAPALLMDLRYGDQLPAGAPPLGFRFHDGRPLLLMQGGLSFAWWFGPPVPWPDMQRALDGPAV